MLMPRPPKQLKSQDPCATLKLFAQNLAEIERHHRRQPSGPELGFQVVAALIISDIVTALHLAAEGKAWEPPGI